jgi:hypothetical protein
MKRLPGLIAVALLLLSFSVSNPFSQSADYVYDNAIQLASGTGSGSGACC